MHYQLISLIHYNFSECAEYNSLDAKCVCVHCALACVNILKLLHAEYYIHSAVCEININSKIC